MMRNDIKISYDKVMPDKMTADKIYQKMISESAKKGKNNRVLKAALIAACLLMAFIISIQIMEIPDNNIEIPLDNDGIAYRVVLSINPAVEFSVNNDDYVVDVIGLNDDGEALIDGIDFEGLSLKNATIVVVNQLLRYGYISASAVQNEIQLYFSENTGPLETLDVMSNVVEVAAGLYNINLTKEKLNDTGLNLYLSNNYSESEVIIDAENVSSMTFEYFLEDSEEEAYVGNVYIYANDEELFADFIDFAGMSVKKAALWAFQELYDKNYIRDDVTLTFILEEYDADKFEDLADFLGLLIEEKGLALGAEYDGEMQIVISPTDEVVNGANYKYTIPELCNSQLIKNKEDTAPLQMQILKEVYTQGEIDWFFTPRYWAVVPDFIGMTKERALELLDITGFIAVLDEIDSESSQFTQEQMGTVVYQDTNPGNTWEVGSKFQISVLKSVYDNNLPNEDEREVEVTPEVLYAEEGTLDNIKGADYAKNLKSITAGNIKEGSGIDLPMDSDDTKSIKELIGTLYFAIPDNEILSGEIHLYQINVSDGESGCFIDIYKNGDGYSGSLDNMYKMYDCENILAEIVDILDKQFTREDIDLSDDEAIQEILNRISLGKDTTPKQIEAGRYYICDEHFRVNRWDSDFADVNGYKEVNISAEQLNEILYGIYTNYMISSFEVISIVKDTVMNSEFRIAAEYDGYKLQIYADYNAVYVRTKLGNEYYMIRVDNKGLHKQYATMMGDADGGFTFDDFENTEYISIFYVKDEHKKDYPENGRLTEVKITDKDIINQIVETISATSTPTMTYPSRENADIIFHTDKGDIYCKIKCPFTDDKEQFNWILSEPTIIIKGYYWFNCPQLYEILKDIN